MKMPLVLPVLVAFTVLTTGCVVRARPVVVGGPVVAVATPPPPLRAEEIPPPPGRAWAWQPGHWRWNGAAYIWVPGHYERRPRASAVWVPEQWVARDGQWVLQPGYWAYR